jgi:hypothetical protein
MTECSWFSSVPSRKRSGNTYLKIVSGRLLPYPHVYSNGSQHSPNVYGVGTFTDASILRDVFNEVDGLTTAFRRLFRVES